MSTAQIPVIPTFRYRDAPSAIDFLIKAFGFSEHMVVPDGEGGIAHAQLTFGDGRGMIMLGSARDDEWGQYVRPAKEAGVNTGGAYVIVEDVDAHCEQARKAGAEIIVKPADQDYGGRNYACKDPEGHVWSFGSYDPLA
ncbi:MAG: VOC family protein [Cellvibrionaceae bacterium]